MKKFLHFMMVAIVMAAFASCSKDDEPGDPTYDGVSIYINAIESFYNDEGQPKYVATDTEGVYMVIADNSAVADYFIRTLLENPQWNGENVTVKLGEGGEEGTLKITASGLPAGIYDEIIINIKGDLENYPPYTLRIVTEEYFNHENSGGISGGGVVRLDNPSAS